MHPTSSKFSFTATFYPLRQFVGFASLARAASTATSHGRYATSSRSCALRRRTNDARRRRRAHRAERCTASRICKSFSTIHRERNYANRRQVQRHHSPSRVSVGIYRVHCEIRQPSQSVSDDEHEKLSTIDRARQYRNVALPPSVRASRKPRHTNINNDDLQIEGDDPEHVRCVPSAP